MKIAMQCRLLLFYVMYLVTILFALQHNLFISLLWFSFSDAAGNEQLPCRNSSSQKSVPKSLQLKKHYVTFKNRNM